MKKQRARTTPGFAVVYAMLLAMIQLAWFGLCLIPLAASSKPTSVHVLLVCAMAISMTLLYELNLSISALPEKRCRAAVLAQDDQSIVRNVLVYLFRLVVCLSLCCAATVLVRWLFLAYQRPPFCILLLPTPFLVFYALSPMIDGRGGIPKIPYQGAKKTAIVLACLFSASLYWICLRWYTTYVLPEAERLSSEEYEDVFLTVLVYGVAVALALIVLSTASFLTAKSLAHPKTRPTIESPLPTALLSLLIWHPAIVVIANSVVVFWEHPTNDEAIVRGQWLFLVEITAFSLALAATLLPSLVLGVFREVSDNRTSREDRLRAKEEQKRREKQNQEHDRRLRAEARKIKDATIKELILYAVSNTDRIRLLDTPSKKFDVEKWAEYKFREATYPDQAKIVQRDLRHRLEHLLRVQEIAEKWTSYCPLIEEVLTEDQFNTCFVHLQDIACLEPTGDTRFDREFAPCNDEFYAEADALEAAVDEAWEKVKHKATEEREQPLPSIESVMEQIEIERKTAIRRAELEASEFGYDNDLLQKEIHRINEKYCQMITEAKSNSGQKLGATNDVQRQ